MTDEREWVAYHEAGHAVVAWWLKCWFPKVSVTERSVECPLLGDQFFREDCDVYIMVALGGPLAEELVAGENRLPAESNNAAACDEAKALGVARCRDTLAVGMGKTDPRYVLAPDKLVETLRALTRELLRAPTVRAGVQAVAQDLLGHDPLQYDEVSGVLEKIGLMPGIPRELGPWFPSNR
jgi:hypothetical protein